ncbi:MAG: hypothetical protein ACYTGX_15400 [Planctomycetota bacterium]
MKGFAALLLLAAAAGCSPSAPPGPAGSPSPPFAAALRSQTGEQRLVLTGHVVGTEGVREVKEGDTLTWDNSRRRYVMHVHGWNRPGEEPPAVVKFLVPDAVKTGLKWGVPSSGRAMTFQIERTAAGEYRGLHGAPVAFGATTRQVEFDGEVLAVGEAPGFWSGTAVAFQVVTYRVVKLHAGSYEPKRISVSHIILHPAGNDWRIDKQAASLHPKAFAPGKVLRIGATYHGTDKGKRGGFIGCWIPDSVERPK